VNLLNIEKLNGVVATEARDGTTELSVLYEVCCGRKCVEESEVDCRHIPVLTVG
jgi:hypothetical protein